MEELEQGVTSLLHGVEGLSFLFRGLPFRNFRQFDSRAHLRFQCLHLLLQVFAVLFEQFLGVLHVRHAEGAGDERPRIGPFAHLRPGAHVGAGRRGVAPRIHPA